MELEQYIIAVYTLLAIAPIIVALRLFSNHRKGKGS